MIPMAYHYGFRPWDLDQMLVTDFEVYRLGLDEMDRQNAKASEEPAPRPPRRR